MTNTDADHCPRCNSMYTGNLLPGEDPENRYCYTCEIQLGNKAMADRLQTGPGKLDSTLQINDFKTGYGKPRPGRLAPIRPFNRKPVSFQRAPQGSSSHTTMMAVGQLEEVENYRKTRWWKIEKRRLKNRCCMFRDTQP